MPKKSADIKVRVDPFTKSLLIQIADEQLLDLSDIVRLALRDFVQKETHGPARRSPSNYEHA